MFLHKNKLTNLDKNVFKGLTSLTRLELDDNYLTKLDKNIFDGLNSLKELSLNDNKLTTLDKDIFNGLNKTLVQLYLANNKLANLDKNIFSGLNALLVIDIPQHLQYSQFKGLKQHFGDSLGEFDSFIKEQSTYHISVYLSVYNDYVFTRH